MRHITFRLVPAAALLFAFGGIPFGSGPRLAQSQVYRLAELNTEQIRALDRQTTVVIIPGGVLEEHGPYLPSYTDGYANERLTANLAAAIAARPGWTAVVFPPIPLGAGGANVIGAKYSFPGSYGVRPAVLRAVFMDLATEFGEQGFRWIFVVHGHGGPHNRVLDEAGDYFRDTYGGHMVHLVGLRPENMAWDSVIQGGPAGPGTAGGHAMHTMHAGGPELQLGGLTATAAHAAGYLLVTTLIAVIVYERVGLRMLRSAWINLDLIWALALVITGVATLVV
jgi:creatinine amidohydrolase/Fe(II)-dependent formamide hydrolase-like protein